MTTLPLVDKYKPKKFNNICLPLEIKRKFKKYIERESVNNTMIVGKCGTGKTLLLKIFVKELLKNRYDEACLNLNTTNHRGLKDLESILPSFCEKAVYNFTGKKIIIIDEADSLTKKAQNLITNIMNDYEQNVAFIFTCNDCKKMEDSIISKCTSVYIPQFTPINIKNYLEELCSKENISFTEDGLELIAESSNGDLRCAINLLDNVRNGFPVVNVENSKELLYRPGNSDIEDFISKCVNKDLFGGINILKKFKNKGFCGTDILISIFNYLSYVLPYKKTPIIDEKTNIEFISVLIYYYTRMSEGIDTDLQLYACVSKLVLLNV